MKDARKPPMPAAGVIVVDPELILLPDADHSRFRRLVKHSDGTHEYVESDAQIVRAVIVSGRKKRRKRRPRSGS